MGCDIHIYRERLNDQGEWESGDTWAPSSWNPSELEHDERGGGRSYELFTALAHVRCYGRAFPEASFYPRGMPLRPSDEVAKAYVDWEGDGHNHSHLYLFELEELRAMAVDAEWHQSTLAQLDEIIAGLQEIGGVMQRVVFWFDN